jgi:hypothetical protein
MDKHTKGASILVNELIMGRGLFLQKPRTVPLDCININAYSIVNASISSGHIKLPLITILVDKRAHPSARARQAGLGFGGLAWL